MALLVAGANYSIQQRIDTGLTERGTGFEPAEGEYLQMLHSLTGSRVWVTIQDVAKLALQH